MSHHYYEERLEQDIASIRAQVREVSQRIDAAIQDSIHALVKMDFPLAYQTVLGDLAINRAIRNIDRFCHYFVARHLPSAGHLRFISSVLRMNIELERIGDYAVTICRETVQLSSPLEESVRREVERIGEDVLGMFRQATRSFQERNPDLAEGTMGFARQVERSLTAVFEILVEQGQGGVRPIRDLFATLVIFNRLGRMAAQSKNLCEEVVFAFLGATKPPKVYRILFLDDDDSVLAPMAALFARKAYPNSGEYSCAGRKAGADWAPGFVEFMEGLGIEVAGLKPRKLDLTFEELNRFHVIVSLQGSIKEYLEKVPFHTVALEWDIRRSGGGGLPDHEEIYKQVTGEVRRLMERLRGEEAS